MPTPQTQQSPGGAGLVANNQITERTQIIRKGAPADKPDPGPTEKEVNSTIARLALNRHVVHRAKADDFIVCKYGMTRYCADGQELIAFAKQLGVLQ